jgi:hypothetical protein
MHTVPIMRIDPRDRLNVNNRISSPTSALFPSPIRLPFGPFPAILPPMNPLHWAFDKLYPVIRFVYEKILGHDWFEQVTPQLWQGGAPAYNRDYAFIMDNGINAVLDVRAEREDDRALYAANGVSYLRLKVLDVMVPEAKQLDEGTAFIRDQVNAGKIVLVHCAKGRGRSATLMAGYLMRYEGYTYGSAKELLDSKRSLTNLQGRHQRTLED